MKDKISFLLFILIVSSSLVWLGCSEAAEGPVDDVGEVAPTQPAPGEMVLIPAGEFIMGSDLARTPPLEVPEHTVDLPSYYMDVYELTNGEWIQFLTESDYGPKGDWRRFYSIGKEDYPVVNVTWEDAKTYCKASGKRLPTEAEWEKAARGTDGLKYPWGEVWKSESNTEEHGVRNNIEVGEMPADRSPFGIYDMMGNTQEWTANELEPYPDNPDSRDESFRNNFMAVRGGSYAMRGRSMALYMRSAYLADAQYGIGFRCARDSEETVQESEEGEGEEEGSEEEE
jgi:formylglycine-generating enzyme required for sulfatase activity